MNFKNPIKIGDRIVQIVGLIGSNGEIVSVTDNAIDINLSNQGFIDTNNSSTTPLGINETFTGIGTNIIDYASFFCAARRTAYSRVQPHFGHLATPRPPGPRLSRK